MKKNDYQYYQKIKDWDFSFIQAEYESLTNWDMHQIIRAEATKDSKILDLGTGGGEKLLKEYPEVKEILATDYSTEMIKTAKNNLKKSGRKNITFKIMDNLNMQAIPNNYYDIISARNTETDPKQIYNKLKKGGLLILQGVDKMDCYELKRTYGKGQGMSDPLPMSVVDYEHVLQAGFKDVELVPLHERAYYKSREDFYALLLKTPILDDFSETDNDNNEFYKTKLDDKKIAKYIKNNISEKGIRLIRRYYGITARK